jgi:hypothetical protein
LLSLIFLLCLSSLGESLYVAQPSSLEDFCEIFAELRHGPRVEPLVKFVIVEGGFDRWAGDGELVGEEALEELLGVTEHEEAAVAAVGLHGDLGLDQGELLGGERRGLRLVVIIILISLEFPLELQIDPTNEHDLERILIRLLLT